MLSTVMRGASTSVAFGATCLAVACASNQGDSGSIGSGQPTTGTQATTASASTIGNGISTATMTVTIGGSQTAATTGSGTSMGGDMTSSTTGAGSGGNQGATVSVGGASMTSTGDSDVTAGGTTTATDTTGGGTGGTGGYDSHCTREETEANKAVVRDGITQVFVNGNGDAIDDYWTDPYIQHNPAANSGVETFKSFFSNVSPGFYSLTRLIGECDKVLIHGSYQGSGPTFDMLRVDPESMKMVEHWDAAARGSLDGATEVVDVELTASNRELVIGFVNNVLIGGNPAEHGNYLADDIVDYAAGGESGAQAFIESVSGITYNTIHHQIADGNFVFILSEGTEGGTAYGYYDLFAVEYGKIAEHWGARLQVQQGVSGEGIF